MKGFKGRSRGTPGGSTVRVGMGHPETCFSGRSTLTPLFVSFPLLHPRKSEAREGLFPWHWWAWSGPSLLPSSLVSTRPGDSELWAWLSWVSPTPTPDPGSQLLETLLHSILSPARCAGERHSWTLHGNLNLPSSVARRGKAPSGFLMQSLVLGSWEYIGYFEFSHLSQWYMACDSFP